MPDSTTQPAVDDTALDSTDDWDDDDADEFDDEALERPFMRRAMPYLLVIAGLIGLAAATILTVEKMELLRDPAYVPSCNFNPLVSCKSVMVTPQASAFGITNSLIGIAGFAVVVAIGMAMLAGARFARWFWWGLQAGTIFGVLFVHWLVAQSLYVIGALCPYCMVVWVVMIPLFWYVTLYNLAERHIPTPAGFRPVIEVLTRIHWVVVAAWYLVIGLLILAQFWSFWSTLL